MVKVVIIGCGRSGTTYISNIFQSVGIDIKHEKMGINGTSDWHLTTKFIGNNYTILHQIRHPLKTMASMFTAPITTWKSINKYIPLTLKNTLLDAMRYWYFWNLIAESRACFTYRVENLYNEWGTICSILGIGGAKYEEISKTTNSRNHSELTWDELEKEDGLLTTAIHWLANKYGY
jgi:hypothetical protein